MAILTEKFKLILIMHNKTVVTVTKYDHLTSITSQGEPQLLGRWQIVNGPLIRGRLRIRLGQRSSHGPKCEHYQRVTCGEVTTIKHHKGCHAVA